MLEREEGRKRGRREEGEEEKGVFFLVIILFKNGNFMKQRFLELLISCRDINLERLTKLRHKRKDKKQWKKKMEKKNGKKNGKNYKDYLQRSPTNFVRNFFVINFCVKFIIKHFEL